jgi:hypothetical protein
MFKSILVSTQWVCPLYLGLALTQNTLNVFNWRVAELAFFSVSILVLLLFNAYKFENAKYQYFNEGVNYWQPVSLLKPTDLEKIGRDKIPLLIYSEKYERHMVVWYNKHIGQFQDHQEYYPVSKFKYIEDIDISE